jgi:hypothetical protein
MKFAVIETGLLGIVKTQGFAVSPVEHETPVTFHPENIQLAAGVAVTFTMRPTASWHPEGHDGATKPSPTVAVVSVPEHVPWVQLIVTVRTGAL